MSSRLPYYATIAGSLAIAVGLVVVSYGHIRTFAIDAGAAEWEAAVIAATVDALVVLSIAAIGHARGVGQKPPAMAKVALIVGIVATTGANLHHGWAHGWMGIVVSLWVPVAAELAYQLAMSAVRVGATGGQEDVHPAICGGHLVTVATVMARVTTDRMAAEEAAAEQEAAMAARPVICGHVVPVATVTARVATPDIRPVICGGRLVSVAEVLARTPVATAKPAAKKRTPATAKPAATSDREDIVLEWLTAPGSPDNRVATATGPDIVRVLAGHGHQVSERTARRVLKEVREALGEVATA